MVMQYCCERNEEMKLWYSERMAKPVSFSNICIKSESSQREREWEKEGKKVQYLAIKNERGKNGNDESKDWREQEKESERKWARLKYKEKLCNWRMKKEALTPS